MPSIELTAAQAKALRHAAWAWIEGKEEEFRSGEWEHWADEDARLYYDEMARLLECMDILLQAVPMPLMRYAYFRPEETTNAND